MKLSDLYPIRSKAIIYESELNYISRCVLDCPNIETGGDLFGFWTHSGYPVIQYAIGPGPRANHQFAYFNQDLNYLDEIGMKLRTSHALQHIGEWHSHHQFDLAEPSQHDISTVCKAIHNYSLDKFFLVIANIQNTSSSVNGFMFYAPKGRNFDYTGWVVLEGTSPIRIDFESKYINLNYCPKTQYGSLHSLSKTQLGNLNYVKPHYSPDYWMLDKSSHSILKQMVEKLNKEFKSVLVYQNTHDNTVFLECSNDDESYHIIFPNEYPRQCPLVVDKLKSTALPGMKWDVSNGLLIGSLEYINGVVKSNKEKNNVTTETATRNIYTRKILP